MVGASNASTIHVTDEVAMAPLDHVDITKEPCQYNENITCILLLAYWYIIGRVASL